MYCYVRSTQWYCNKDYSFETKKILGHFSDTRITQKMTMKILITGASGYLGQHVLYHLAKNNKNVSYDIVASFGSLESFKTDCEAIGIIGGEHNVKLVNSEEFNLAKPETFWKQNGPFDIVLHLAAQSNLNKCEADHDTAKLMNVDIPLSLYQQAEQQQHSCLFIALSTDQVFDGTSGNYTENDICQPVNYYGQTKLNMEQSLLSRWNSNKTTSTSTTVTPIILRSSNILGGPTPIGTCRKNSFLQFVRSAVENEDKQEVTFFEDEYRNAIFVGDVVHILECLIQKQNATTKVVEGGIYNMGGPERVNRHQIALAVAKWANVHTTSHLVPVKRGNIQTTTTTTTSNVPKAQSPLDISMTSHKLETLTGMQFSKLHEIVSSSFK